MKNSVIIKCQTKKSYKDKLEAEDTATYLYWKKGMNLEPYLCNFCACWHLTKSKIRGKFK